MTTTTGKLTLITTSRPATLGKVFRLTPTGLEKKTAGQMVESSFQVLEFTSAESLGQILANVGNDQAIMASLPADGRAAGKIVTKAEKPNHPGALSRTKDCFWFASNQASLCILDYDPPAGETPLTRDQLWALLLATVPGLESAGVIWWCSGSSFIYQGEAEIQGLRGQRLYILIQDLADTERFGEVLFKRLWLAGRGRVEISTAGSLLMRSIFDQAMAQVARLDFIGGAVCEPPLEQRRGLPVVLSNGCWLDTRAALPDLTTPEQVAYEDLVEAAKLKAAPEAEVVKAKWQAERLPCMVERLVKSGVALDQAQDRAERTVSSGCKLIQTSD